MGASRRVIVYFRQELEGSTREMLVSTRGALARQMFRALHVCPCLIASDETRVCYKYLGQWAQPDTTTSMHQSLQKR